MDTQTDGQRDEIGEVFTVTLCLRFVARVNYIIIESVDSKSRDDI